MYMYMYCTVCVDNSVVQISNCIATPPPTYMYAIKKANLFD